MSQLVTAPPPPEILAGMAAIPRMSVVPSVLVRQEGPEGRRGPEEAGAVLMLQATFATEEGAAGFWHAALPLMQLLADAPGFIRRFSFPDGPTITLLAFWRTLEDAKAFAASPEHRAAVRDLHRLRWQHSHFAAVWEMASNRGRQLFCDSCGRATDAPADACKSCGAALFDPFTSAE
jgi:heme-degrading monooxygenase HmoA